MIRNDYARSPVLINPFFKKMRVVTAPSLLLKEKNLLLNFRGSLEALKSLKLQVNLNLRKKFDLRKVVL